MSKTEGFEILNSENAASIGDKAEKTVRLCPLVARRNLVNISNLSEMPLIEDKKSQSIPITTKEYIEKLQKEKVALSRMLSQRNKLIELSGIELEKLRLSLIAVQEQNRKLAVSHTQMLAKLNSGKDKLKELHHVLGCQNGLLKARNLEFKGKAGTRPCKRADVEVNSNKSQMEDEPPKEDRGEEKPRNAKRRVRSSSLGSSEPSQSEEYATKRPSTRRRSSARFKTVESREDDDVFEMDNAELSKCPSLDEHLPQIGSNSVLAFVKDEDIICESREPRRSSLCRPSRMAAKKVQSYKEIPLKTKLRRSE
ncbi:hypothetical protein ACS0TY_009381 [Phlomoides rotata]